MNNARTEYGDIIDLPHHQSDKRPHMSLHDRAAQFAPFAALRGYDDEITETARTTDSKIELSAEETEQINENIHNILNKIKETPKAKITYFVPDERKDGGEYVTITANIRRVDETQRIIHLTDGGSIDIDELSAIELIDKND